VSPRTLAPAPVHDRRYWRMLLRQVHPDVPGGSHDLFVWAQFLREHVAGDEIEEPSSRSRREPPKHHTTGDRIPFEDAYQRFEGHEELVAYARLVGEERGGVYGQLLALLADLYPSTPGDHVLERQERIGATYKQLAYAGRLVGMDGRQRTQWYEVARTVPLSQRCVGHIIGRLQSRAA
jgi:hypothetical protein